MATQPAVRAESGTLQVFSLTDQAVEQLPVAGVRFAVLAQAREPALARAMLLDLHLLRGRLAEAGSAVVAQDGDEIAGYGWVQYGLIRIPDLRLEVLLPAHHAYIWDCLTMPQFRGRGIFPGLLRFLVEDLRRRRILKAWAATAPGNSSSVRAFAKAGFRLVATTDGGIGSFSARPTHLATPEEAAFLRASFPTEGARR